jgi:NAD(P)-dependent dehydrogenase (short-subunit alcohol dehydrogenase family)
MTTTNQKFKGKKAVVTGGTHGMGMAIVKALLEEGAQVLLTGRNPQNLEAAKQALGPQVHVIASDAANMEDIRALSGIVTERLGQVDYVFINVGYSVLEPFTQVTEATYDKTFNINTKGAFFTLQQLAPLIKEGGAITFTTSVANVLGVPGMSVYSGAKAAVRSFVQGFAAELLPKGIRVNAVSPGYIDTPTGGIPEATPEDRIAFEQEGNTVTPMKRHGTAEEVAAAALFLAADATFTTGFELMVDGGLGGGIIHPG